MQRTTGDIEALVADIRKQAQQQGIDAEERARRRAETVLEAALPEEAEVTEALLREADADAEALRSRLLSQGELDARRRTIEARERLLDAVWSEAESRLRELVAAPEYPRVLESLALLAARELGPERLILAADPRGHELLTRERLSPWEGRAGVTFERAEAPADTWGGLLARSGRERYDATLPQRLEQAREALRERIFETLAGGAE